MQDADNYNLTQIIDSTKINQSMADEVDYDEGSTETKYTNQTAIEKLLEEYNDVSDASVKSSSEDIEVFVKSRNPSISEISENSIESVKMISPDVSDVFSESTEISEPGIQYERKEKVKTSSSTQTNNHVDILNDIDETLADLKGMGVKVPACDERRLRTDEVYAAEYREMTYGEYQNNTIATGLREIIVQASSIVPMIFNGKYNKTLGKRMPDLTGYPNHVKMQIVQVRRETVDIAKKCRSKLGDSTISAFKLFRLLVIPLVTTYLNNKSNATRKVKSAMQIEDYDEFESSDESSEDESTD